MATIFLREATEHDIPEIVRVIQAGFEQYRGRLDPPSGAHNETIETIRAKLNRGHAALAMADQQIVGCVLYEPEDDHIYLGRLAVLPAYRQSGIGSKLIAYVESQTRKLGYARVRLGVRLVLKENQAYFHNLGYRVVSYEIHPGYVEPTCANLEKDVVLENV
ncbi:MAG: GNAT family N-acetyltransferase [Chloroflexi bacterium]|nr:GNAT family N-acetyltransferase [Chloroflexota bacterium]